MSADEPVRPEVSPPPPSAALLARVAETAPVRTRRPKAVLAGSLLAALAVAVVCFLRVPMRSDLPFINHPLLIMLGAAWSAGVIAGLAAAFLPRTGQVSPDGGRAALVAGLVSGVAPILCGLVRAEADGHTLHAQGGSEELARLAHCLRFDLGVWALIGILGVLALRRVVLASKWRVGAALGAAGGALGGLILNFVCPYGGAFHVGVAHGGAVLMGALLGGAAVTLANRS